MKTPTGGTDEAFGEAGSVKDDPEAQGQDGEDRLEMDQGRHNPTVALVKAAPMEDLERLERDLQELREVVVDLLEIAMIVDDKYVWLDAIKNTHERLKERTVFRPDFDFQWEVGPDQEVRFEEDDAA